MYQFTTDRTLRTNRSNNSTQVLVFACFMCMDILPMCMTVHHMLIWFSQRSRGGHPNTLELELLMVVSCHVRLEEQLVSLIMGPSL